MECFFFFFLRLQITWCMRHSMGTGEGRDGESGWWLCRLWCLHCDVAGRGLMVSHESHGVMGFPLHGLLLSSPAPIFVYLFPILAPQKFNVLFSTSRVLGWEQNMGNKKLTSLLNLVRSIMTVAFYTWIDFSKLLPLWIIQRTPSWVIPLKLWRKRRHKPVPRDPRMIKHEVHARDNKSPTQFF